MSGPVSIRDLVSRFRLHIDDYTRGKFNETQVRVEYIDPLFIALGWEVRNEQGYAEAYKDNVPHLKQQIQHRIDHTDRQIDALVYELYELTDEEIRIVEGSDA